MGEFLEIFVSRLAPIVTRLLELIGILIILFGTFKALWIFLKDGFSLGNRNVKIALGEALALSLEFKLGAEIIKTVIVRDINELIILAFVVALRVVLTAVIHWEVSVANRETLSVKEERDNQDFNKK